MNRSKKRCHDNSKMDSSDIARPNRFRTAYNFFFVHEHASFEKFQADSLPLIKDDPQPSSSDVPKPSSEQAKNQVNFRNVSKIIASKWKGISAQEKKVFEDMADKDLIRYQREMEVYHQKVAGVGGTARQNAKEEPSFSKSSVLIRPQQISKPEEESHASDEAKSVPESSHAIPPKQKTFSALAMPPTAKESKHLHLLNIGSTITYAVEPRDTVLDGTITTLKEVKISAPQKQKKTCSFQSTPTVNEDLTISVSDRDNWCNKKRKRTMSPLTFQTNKLYGREEHVAMIMNAYGKLGEPTIMAKMVLVSGHSGSGKSALVQHVQKPIIDMGGHFICGKFDFFRQMEPLSAIINAFSEFCNEVATKETENLRQMKIEIQEKVGSAIVFLANIIPSLRRIVQIPTKSSVSIGNMEAQHMLKHSLQLFVKAIATPHQPLVLFLDDLQWADPSSLDLIDSLVSDVENKSLLFIGAYRDNEVDDTHPLADKLRSIERRQANITKINVGDLSKEDANEMIADMIKTPTHLTQSLTNAVYHRTSGNVLFILEFLSSICDDGFLFFSSETQQWQWETAMIESKKVGVNTVELLLRKILQLPKESQSALKLMACLGYCCEDFVLSSMAASDAIGSFGCSDLITSLQFAVKEGLLNHVGSSYRFAHDQIQNVAYSLIPKCEQGNMHIWIGSQVWANKSAAPEKALFIVVGQLNKGALVIKETNQRIQLAELNRQAAQKSKSLAAFEPAAFYFNKGINLLGKNSWEDHYDLCLQLYSSCAEAEYYNGDFDEMNKKLQEVFSKARSLDDKLDSYYTYISALHAQNRIQEASEIGLHVLSKLGESFPKKSDTKSIVMVEFKQIKQMVERKTNDDLLKLKAMNDNNKIAAMRIMYALAQASFDAGTEMCALIILRMVQISLKYGICDESAYCFSALGGTMCKFKDINNAYRFGQLSLRLLKENNTKKCLPGVHACVYGFINPVLEHYRESLRPLEHAYKEGIRCGDLIFAMACVVQYCIYSFFGGEELPIMEKMFRKYDKILNEHKQEIFRKKILPYWQAVLNLMGHANDPKQLIGDVMDQEQILKEEILERKRTRTAASIYHIRSWLAYIFGNYDLASKMMEERLAIPLVSATPVLSCSFLYVEGLISFAMARSMGGANWTVHGNKCIDEMKQYTLFGPWNCHHKLLLLQAESAYLSGEYDSAALCYNDAIDAASKNGFVQDQALAYERAGIFHSEQGNTSSASNCYGQAHNLYLKWGAKCKADHLRLMKKL